MKYGARFGSLAALALLAVVSSASAQPRPPRPVHEEHRKTEHQETEGQIRARLQKEQQDDRAKRQLAKKDTRAWDASREQRAAEARAQLASTWGALAEQPEARAELATHAERMAQLNRILDVAQDKGDTALVTRTDGVIQREIARDTRVLQGIRAKAGIR